MDSTLISVCLSLFPWAAYRTKKCAFKLHTLLDQSGYLPSFFVLTVGQQNVPKNNGVVSDSRIRLLSFIKFQTKCRHSLHELTRIIDEILLDTSNFIETLTIPFEAYIRVKRKQVQLSLF